MQVDILDDDELAATHPDTKMQTERLVQHSVFINIYHVDIFLNLNRRPILLTIHCIGTRRVSCAILDCG